MSVDVYSFLEEKILLERPEIERFIATSPYRYKVYKIPKRNGSGLRTIAHPSRELKLLQRLVANKYLSPLPVHDAATAYRKGKNIRYHANCHRKAKFLLKMDFKDFFPSIKPHDLLECLQNSNKTEIDSRNKDALARIFFYRANRKTKDLRLSIGAPSSPLISNIVMYEFDTQISRIASENKIAYSRYADDLAFSTIQPGLLHDFEKMILEFVMKIQRPSLRLNPEKTVHVSSKHNMHLTGLVLTSSGKVSIGRKKKREIKSLVHKYLIGSLQEDKHAYLRGYLSYCLCSDPDFIKSLKDKYGYLEIDEIMKCR